MARKFKISFECENAVFADYLHDAIADALLCVSKKIRQTGNLHGLVYDNNGNLIGNYDLREHAAVTLSDYV